MFLTAFYVKPDFRRQGIGSRLLDFIIKHSAIVGVEVSTASNRAIEFYKALGFKKFKGDFGEVLLGLDLRPRYRRFDPA